MHKKWLPYFLIIGLLITIITPTVPQRAIAEETTASTLVVAAEILYLREGPGLSYPVLETLKDGQALTALEQQGDWIHVTVGDQEGWVAAWLTKPTAEVATSTEQKTIISQVDHLNVRAEPSLSAAVLTQLPSGSEAVYIKQEPEWIQIQYGDFKGWVSETYVTIKEETPKEDIKQEQPDAEQAAEIKPTTSTLENDPNTFTIIVDTVNIRKKADLTSKKLGVANKGQQFKVIDRNHNWVQIEYSKKKKGWVYSFYGTFTVQAQPNSTDDVEETTTAETVTIIYNGTNLRESASTSSNVVTRVDAGETYPIIGTEGEWYQIALPENEVAYVANWVVTNNQAPTEETSENKLADRKEGTLKGVTIVLDPGHGGNDHGTTGTRGTAEKDITTKTAELLKSKLRAAGATVILTRESDVYVDLRKRVAIGHQADADAFISIHYDAIDDSSVTGFTTYYTNSYQKEIADYVHAGLASKVSIRDRGVQAGNYLVLRENRQNAILIELGYLSNPTEERSITSEYYREQATLGIYQGLLNYFDTQLQ